MMAFVLLTRADAGRES